MMRCSGQIFKDSDHPENDFSILSSEMTVFRQQLDITSNRMYHFIIVESCLSFEAQLPGVAVEERNLIEYFHDS